MAQHFFGVKKPLGIYFYSKELIHIPVVGSFQAQSLFLKSTFSTQLLPPELSCFIIIYNQI